MADDRKTCNICGENQPVTSFRTKRSVGRKTHIAGFCKACETEKHRTAVAAKKDSPAWKYLRRASQIKYKYGISPKCYIDMMLAQDFCCPICTHPVGAGDWAVDHDHSCCPGDRSCGKCVRGLLDRKCNTLLGQARDDVATLSRAMDYLEAHGGKES